VNASKKAKNINPTLFLILQASLIFRLTHSKAFFCEVSVKLSYPTTQNVGQDKKKEGKSRFS
jgi:hypothetical protein